MIINEDQLFHERLDSLWESDDPLYLVVHEAYLKRTHVNLKLLWWIQQIYGLSGFSGIKGTGVHLGSRKSPTDNPPVNRSANTPSNTPPLFLLAGDVAVPQTTEEDKEDLDEEAIQEDVEQTCSLLEYLGEEVN